jgi:hypothetical protein
MDDNDVFRLEHDRKVSFFDCHRRFLPSNHEFRDDTVISERQNRYKRATEAKIQCRNHTKARWPEGDKNGMFEGYGVTHNWTHKSCLSELPYAKALILPHNIDLMHQEQNIVENIMSMCLDVTSFTKDNLNARKDLTSLCDHPNMEAKPNARGNLKRTKTPYRLKPTKRKELLSWLKTLKFSDCYVANIKRAVNVDTGKLNGLRVTTIIFS